jgi:hypothetical protein
MDRKRWKRIGVGRSLHKSSARRHHA